MNFLQRETKEVNPVDVFVDRVHRVTGDNVVSIRVNKDLELNTDLIGSSLQWVLYVEDKAIGMSQIVGVGLRPSTIEKLAENYEKIIDKFDKATTKELERLQEVKNTEKSALEKLWEKVR